MAGQGGWRVERKGSRECGWSGAWRGSVRGPLVLAKRRGGERRGVGWRGVGWRGVGWRGVGSCRRGVGWGGVGWRGVAWGGVAWGGVAWRGVAWRGVAWRWVVPAAGQDAATSGGRDAAVKPPLPGHTHKVPCAFEHTQSCAPKGWDTVPSAHPFISQAGGEGMVLRLPYDADSPPPSP